MDEYIEREAVIHRIRKVATMIGFENPAVAIDSAITVIERAPTADVAPVRHGRWEVEVGMNFFKERNCPVCKKRIESNFWNYCPNCGALMDVGEQDA